jgi:lipooligosaccharide transport system permease protein
MIGAVRVVQRNAMVYRRIWRGSVFSGFLQPTLFLLSMGLGLGAMVDAGGEGLPGGVTYAEFLAPGLLAASAMQSAGFESTYPILGKLMWFRNYEAITSTPMRVGDVLFGELAWLAVRLSMIATTFVVVMTAFGIPQSPLFVLAIPAAVLTGLAFASPIMAYTATLKRANTFNVLFRFVITPLFLFSGVFFPVERLPDPLEWAARLTPLYHGVELVRGLVLGTPPPAWPIHVAVLVALLCAGFVMGLRTFRRRLYS